MADKAFNECNKDHILLSTTTTTIATSNINANHSGYKINDDNNNKYDKLSFTYSETKKDDLDTIQFGALPNTVQGPKYAFLNTYAKNDISATQSAFQKSDNFWNGQYDWNSNQKYNYQPSYTDPFYSTYPVNTSYNTQSKPYTNTTNFTPYYGSNNYFMDQTNYNYSYQTNKDYANKNLNNSLYPSQNYGSFSTSQNQNYANFNQINCPWDASKDQMGNNFGNSDSMAVINFEFDADKKLDQMTGSYTPEQNNEFESKLQATNGVPIVSPLSHSSTCQSYLSNSLESDENDSDDSEDEENDLNESSQNPNSMSAPWAQPGRF